MTTDIDGLLRRNDWTLRRQGHHNVWACPCGEHLATMSKTASDHRAAKNKLCELRKLECPSLAEELPPPNRQKPTKLVCDNVDNMVVAEATTVFNCVICKTEVSRRNSYAIAPSMRACRTHHGVIEARI